MTEDLDRLLRNRIGTLANAVPVEPEGLLETPVSRRVRLGSTGRGFSIGGVVPAVLIVAVASLIAGIAHVGPFAPGQPPSAVSMTTSDGPFELTLTSARSRYELGEVIDVKATLTYRGQEASVSISHGHGSPMAFGVVERLDGLFLTPAWRQSCERSVLERNVALERPFAKSGSFSGDNPAATDASGFFQDPTLVLPTGIWHLYVVADFGVGDCGEDRHLMRVDLEIGVQATPEGTADASPSIVPPAPQPTLPDPATPGLPVPTDPPVVGGDDDGRVVLELKASHASYVEGTPIDLEAKYWFADGPALVASHYEPELLLSIIQLDATNPTGRATSYDSACTDLGRVEGKERQVVLSGYNIALMRADKVPARLEDLFVGGALLLPVGRWEINANVEGGFARCGQAGNGYALSASIVIEVVPG